MFAATDFKSALPHERGCGILMLAIVFAIFGSNNFTLAYDIGCIYPEEMPEPFIARGQLATLFSTFLTRNKVETPIVVHIAHLFTECQSNCIAYHDDKSLSTITKERPPFSAPPKYFNSWSRTLCMMQCYAMNVEVLVSMHNVGQAMSPLLAAWNFDVLPRSQELMDCNHAPNCLQAVVENLDYDPRIIGQVVHLDILKSTLDDGWNSFGHYTYDAGTDSAVKCTSNCAIYSDTTGYFPRNHPRKKRKKYGPSQNSSEEHKAVKNETDEEKYLVKGANRRWQPLVEHDGYGGFVRQEHVVPHIGFTAKPKLLSKFKKAQRPKYVYKSEAELVVDRLQKLVGDVQRIEMLRVFDNKLFVRGMIQLSFLRQFGPGLKFEDYCMFLAGIDAAEHDAIVQVWREKVRFDRVRPTTVIQRWGDDVIYTYNGDPNSTQPAAIKARDFQSFIRVMPHSEYPSGSASLCTAYAEYTNLYTEEFFDTSLSLLPVAPDGINFACDDEEIRGFGCTADASFHVHNMTELARICGESRLWGGMHFTGAIEAGNKIASGLGELALEFVKTSTAGSQWTNSSYLGGADRPVCGDH